MRPAGTNCAGTDAMLPGAAVGAGVYFLRLVAQTESNSRQLVRKLELLR